MADERDRVRHVARGVMVTSAVVLLGSAVGRLAHADQGGLAAAEGWSVASSCSVAQVHVEPSLEYSAHDQGYVVTTITFDEVPASCAGLSYHLALVAHDGAPVLEVRGVLDEEGRAVSIPAAERPRADSVASTSLSVQANGSAVEGALA